MDFHECPPWCSIVGATVTEHQFFCILHSYHLSASIDRRSLISIMWFNCILNVSPFHCALLVSVTDYGQYVPRTYVTKCYGRYLLNRSVLKTSLFPCLILIQIEILLMYYTNPFCFCFRISCPHIWLKYRRKWRKATLTNESTEINTHIRIHRKIANK